ncbi:CDP-diacylglycerol-inositol 3-phosphatidyltransferase [Zygosaccharomyces mellis]|uniref:CDP-diacylglycerol--inositol 3-phosphatidyltransferase n=1 Tax=Zygosaccharomyces mellis TaxID=42258 RepID=A0A4C2E5S4_9SACH|nr:CDP-diacylglycerol-inositol 3-phosphatidyltransferase [Zygosaccharomyces mellis]
MSVPNKGPVTPNHVLWYVPNQIGYMRVITMVMSLITMSNHPVYTTIIYGVSCLLDALDGSMARKYNQVSRLGAVLDMVTDRSTTTCLICYLSLMYPKWCAVFQILVALDISSHYMHMYASLTDGNTSHKQVGRESSRLLHWYYTRRDVLFTICALNELFYVGLYLYGFERFTQFGFWVVAICLPGYVFKQVTNIIQLNRAALILASMDAKDANKRST